MQLHYFKFQLSVNASDMAGELHLLQQQFLRMQQHVDTMQQHMATERQEMQQQPDRQEMQKVRKLSFEFTHQSY